MTADFLLQYLPPYQANELVIEDDQDVHDIIKEVITAHKEFADHYDCISQYFLTDNADKTAKKLFDFCKKNIKYEVEPKEDQTTRSPAAILTLGHCDCKHYAGFIAGVLDSLKRKGFNVDWCYRFASYDLFESDPGHVFVVIKVNGNEIWIDPVLESYNERLVPYYITDKKVNMLTRLSGITYDYPADNALDVGPVDYRTVGSIFPTSLSAVSVIGESTNGNNTGPNPYLTTPFLGLDRYVEDGGITLGTNWNALADQINNAIASGPMPGHTYDADFVKWVYDNNIKGWNFYYWGGVPAGYDPSAKLAQNNPNYPHVIITPDGRLTFDRDIQIDDAHTNEIHAVWAHIQDLINRFDKVDAAPMKPAVLKAFSQGQYGGISTGNLFTQYRGSSIFEQVGKALEDTVNFVKDVGLKIIGSIPRNAFLGLVGINAFNMAGSLQKKIDNGQWQSIANTWKSVGGNPSKLQNTIQDGATKPAILGSTDTIGEAATGTAALLAAAAPIVAIMLKYLDKDGKLTEALGAAKTYLSAKYPDLDLTDYGFLDKATGLPVNIIIDPADNENLGGGNNDLPSTGPLDFFKKNAEITAALGAGAVYMIAGSKTKNRVMYAIGTGIGIYLLAKSGSSTTGGVSDAQKKSIVIASVNSEGMNGTELLDAINKMNATDIDILYQSVMISKSGGTIPDSLLQKVDAVLAKFGLTAT